MHLEKYLTKLNKIPYINNGGCGIAAYAIYQYLLNQNENPELVYLSEDPIPTTVPQAVYHVMVLWNNHYYDSRGKYPINQVFHTSKYNRLHIHKTNPEFIHIAGNTLNWNEKFKTSNYHKVNRVFGQNIQYFRHLSTIDRIRHTIDSLFHLQPTTA